jgi:hypothetical protein
VDRRGCYRAEPADGTVLAVRWQPFLDAARTLILAGSRPDTLLVGWRKGSHPWALRARVGEAAKLTVGGARWLRSLEAVFLVGGGVKAARFTGEPAPPYWPLQTR